MKIYVLRSSTLQLPEEPSLRIRRSFTTRVWPWKWLSGSQPEDKKSRPWISIPHREPNKRTSEVLPFGEKSLTSGFFLGPLRGPAKPAADPCRPSASLLEAPHRSRRRARASSTAKPKGKRTPGKRRFGHGGLVTRTGVECF